MLFDVVADKLDDMSLSTDNTEVLSSDHSWASAARSQNDSESMRKWPHQGQRILCLSPFSVEIREPDQSFRREGFDACSSPASLNSKQHSLKHSDYEMLLNDGLGGVSSTADNGLLEEQKEQFRFLQVGRKKDFVHIERIDGKAINVLRGLELHTKVFNTDEQKEIGESVYNLQRMGQKGQLRERTYSEPRKWMRSKGRVTMQFGCCYNYAVVFKWFC